MTDAERDIAGFVGKYSPEVAAQFRLARRQLRALFPRGYELVFDTYNALVCGYSRTTKSSGVVVSLAAYPRWVTLFFFDGTKLRDPQGLLRGSGRRVRSVRLDPEALLKARAVRELLKQAIAPFKAEFLAAPKLGTQIRSVMARQRPRLPTPASRPRAPRRRIRVK